MACLTGPQLSEVKAGGGRVGLQGVSCKAPAGGGFFQPAVLLQQPPNTSWSAPSIC